MADDMFQSLADSIPSHLRKEMERELVNGWRLNEVKAAIKAKELASFGYRNEVNTIDGLGSLSARIPLDAYHYWGQRLGYECWDDKQFLKEFKRDNPAVAVNNYAKKTVVRGAVFTADGFIT
jgi:hypothetical protein